MNLTKREFIGLAVSTFAAPLAGRYAFTPSDPSRGSRVTVDVAVSFSDIPEEEETPGEDVQGAVWIGTNGLFNVWTVDGWIPVEAEGVTPQTGVEYTFRFKFDYRNGTYSASVLHNGTYIPLVQSANPPIRQSSNQSISLNSPSPRPAPHSLQSDSTATASCDPPSATSHQASTFG